MSKTEITFLSSRGRGLSNDLALMKDYLVMQASEEVMFRYYLNNERHENPLVAHGHRRAKKDFLDGVTNVIGIDASLSTQIKNMAPEGKRILLAVPYDYQFKNMFLMEQKKKVFSLNTLGRYTHILSGSPFTTELLRRAYRLEDKEIIENVSLPFAYDICLPESRKLMEEKMEFYFPEAKGKKVLSVLVYGDEEKRRKDWETLDVKQWIKNLGEDWFILTNSELLLENAFSMGSQYGARFGYVNKMMMVSKLLYAADVLVTNNGRFAAAFSAQKKPVYVCAYNKNYFEKYMSAAYPGMYFENASKMAAHSYDAEKITGEQAEFCQNMSYSAEENPCGKVAEILGLS